MEQYLPWLAISLSVLSLYVSVYRIYRDRSKLYVFSEICFDCSKDQSEDLSNPPPFLKILAVNKGSRPIILTCFGGETNEKKSATWLLNNALTLNNSSKSLVFSSGFAHDVGVKIEDGDVYEIRINHDDYETLYNTNDGIIEYKKLFLKDVLGKKYFVKNSAKGLKTLFEYRVK